MFMVVLLMKILTKIRPNCYIKENMYMRPWDLQKQVDLKSKGREKRTSLLPNKSCLWWQSNLWSSQMQLQAQRQQNSICYRECLWQWMSWCGNCRFIINSCIFIVFLLDLSPRRACENVVANNINSMMFSNIYEAIAKTCSIISISCNKHLQTEWSNKIRISIRLWKW
jgi:hypothetical protein